MDRFVNCLMEKYADFEGRASRSEYWYFVLFNILAYLGLAIVTVVLAGITGFDLLVAVPTLYLFGTLIPGLAVTARRLHDTDRSGWWQLLNFVPFGGIVLLVFCVQDSTFGRNNNGPNPKRPASV